MFSNKKKSVLLVEKSRDVLPCSSVWDNHYNNCIHRMESIHRTLEEDYDVASHIGLKTLPEEIYSLRECAIIHPAPIEIPRLLELRRKYPRTGLIIGHGFYSWEKEAIQFEKASQDIDGIYILPGIYTFEELIDTIENATKK